MWGVALDILRLIFKVNRQNYLMPTYSHSQLSTFEHCKYKYKLQYIDKVEVDVPTTIEAFVGSRVHEALEKLYKDLQYEKINSKEELILFFKKRWDEEWEDTILINDDYSIENHQARGRRFICEYYDHYKPFNHYRTLGLETADRLDLGNGNQYHIRIDRLACDSSGTYYVMDYKTNKSLKAQEELDEDRQLAMYSIWVRKRFGDCKQVKLVWYFLAHDKEMVSERSDSQLDELKSQVLGLIREIEECVEWPTNVGTLCSWCKFQSLCPAFKHKFEVEIKTPEQFHNDDGVKLVDEYATLDASEKEITARKEEIREKLITFSVQKNVEAVFGTAHKVSVKPFEKIEYPKEEAFIELLKSTGVYEDVSSLNYSKFLAKVKSREIPVEILEKIKSERGFVVRVGKR